MLAGVRHSALPVAKSKTRAWPGGTVVKPTAFLSYGQWITYLALRIYGFLQLSILPAWATDWENVWDLPRHSHSCSKQEINKTCAADVHRCCPCRGHQKLPLHTHPPTHHCLAPTAGSELGWPPEQPQELRHSLASKKVVSLQRAHQAALRLHLKYAKGWRGSMKSQKKHGIHKFIKASGFDFWF